MEGGGEKTREGWTWEFDMNIYLNNSLGGGSKPFLYVHEGFFSMARPESRPYRRRIDRPTREVCMYIYCIYKYTCLEPE